MQKQLDFIRNNLKFEIAKKRSLSALILLSMLLTFFGSNAQNKKMAVIAYYTSGGTFDLAQYPLEKLTHIIFSFSHLKGNKLSISNASDSNVLKQMVGLKIKYPGLKIMLSLGGWGGCPSCSEIFNSRHGRRAFAKSVQETNKYFGADGIDLDWEYPAIAGYPGHQFLLRDKKNFTALISVLRRKLGNNNELSFAAGGFKNFIDSSIEWERVMKKVDRVNLMSYDLVGGYATVTGHHTPLYSTESNPESVDNGVKLLLEKGVDPGKIVIGAAFYARVWDGVADINNGLYQTGKFKTGISFKNIDEKLNTDSGFERLWDSTAQAPYAYNKSKGLFATYDNKLSIQKKTQYVIDKKLGGIMFWQLRDDKYSDGLVDEIWKVEK